MNKWRHSVALRLFAVTFVVIMLFLGTLLTVLAGSFSSFYERRQIKDITRQMNTIRDWYKQEGLPVASAGAFPPYFYKFENDYYATTSLVTMANDKIMIRFSKKEQQHDSIDKPLSGAPKLFLQRPGPEVQADKLMLALNEWREDDAAVDRVMSNGETLVYRSSGIGTDQADGDQLIAVAPIESGGNDDGTVLFAVSSLQPVIGAAKVIRDFSWYAFGVALALVPLLTFLYAGIVTKPLRALNARAGRLASLDFSVRTRWRRKDEIGELARTFDFLADNLNRTLGELHEANDKLRKDIEREKRLERMRRDFVAGVSHELKTPLSLIGGYAEGLKDNIGSGAKRERYAEVILDETRRMAAIVGDMLDLSHLESGRYALKLEPFDVRELLREAASLAQALGGDKNLRVEVRSPEEEEKPAEAVADRLRIGQVLTNLVTNAVRHAPEGGTIELSAARAGENWTLRAYNEGEPIPEEELPRIWSQFYRIDKARSRESGGTGIGLAIVRQILELHGSRYGVRNEQGGVAFEFRLPAADATRN